MKCEVMNCDNDLSARSKLPTCATCRNSMGSWLKRRPAEIIARQERLGKYTDRMKRVRKQK